MAENVKYKRQIRNFLIHKPLQREYTLLMIAIMMATTLMVSFIIHTTMREAFLGNPYRVGRVSPYQVLSEVNQQLIMRVSLTLFLCVIAATLIGIVFLHRVAGPVYRFKLILKRISAGEIPNEFALRERDYFPEVAAEFNNVLKVLRQKRMLAHEIAANLEKLPAENLPEDIKNALTQAKTDLQKM